MKVLYFEESEFEFLAYGETEDSAYQILKQAWKEHCSFTGAEYTRLSRAAVSELDSKINPDIHDGTVRRKHKSETYYRLYYEHDAPRVTKATIPDNQVTNMPPNTKVYDGNNLPLHYNDEVGVTDLHFKPPSERVIHIKSGVEYRKEREGKVQIDDVWHDAVFYTHEGEMYCRTKKDFDNAFIKKHGTKD